MKARSAPLALALGLVLGLDAGSAFAASPTAPSAALATELINGLRTPGVTVIVGGVTSPGGDRAEIRDLVITMRPPGAAPADTSGVAVLSIGRLDVQGLARTPAGLAARALHAGGIVLRGEGAAISLAEIKLDGLDLPTSDWPAFSPTRPIASLALALKAIGRVTLQRGESRDLRVTPTAPGATPVLALERILVSGIAGGRMTALQLGRIAAQGAGTDATTMESVMAAAIDIGAIARVFDASSYLPGAPERDWRSLLDDVAVTGFQRRLGEETTRFDRVAISGLKLRPFRSDVTAALDASAADPAYFSKNPDKARETGIAIADSVQLGTARIDGFALALPGGPMSRVACASIRASGVTPLRLSEAVAEACTFAGAAGQTVSVGEFALSDLSGERGLTAVKNDPATAELLPSLGAARLRDVVVRQGEAEVKVDLVNLALGAHVRGIPTRVAASVENLSVPLAAIPDPNVRAVMTQWGRNPAQFNLGVSAAWREATNEVEVDGLSLDLVHLGRFGASGVVTQIPRAAFEQPETALAQLNQAGVRRLKLTYDDASLADRVLGLAATANKQTPDDLRKALARVVPNILAQVPDTTIRGRLTFALLGFLNAPGSLEISSTVTDPVPLAKLMETVRTALPTLPVLLKLDARSSRPQPSKSG